MTSKDECSMTIWHGDNNTNRLPLNEETTASSIKTIPMPHKITVAQNWRMKGEAKVKEKKKLWWNIIQSGISLYKSSENICRYEYVRV